MHLILRGLAAAVAVLCLGTLSVASDTEPEQTAPSGSSAEDGGDTEPEANETSEVSMLTVYIPPSRGAARVRTGGGTRGIGGLSLSVLAPDHVGLTTRAQPSLGWYTPKPIEGRVDFTLLRDGDIEPLSEVTLEGPIGAGIHFVDLAELGVSLEPGTSYEWSIAVVPDPEQRDLDVVAGGVARLATEDVSAGGETPSYRALARRGIWYDAIADLSGAIATSPDDGALRRERAALLDQVGLDAVASYDRAAARGAPNGAMD